MQEGNSVGVLLLHGFGDTPQTLRLLASSLHGSGFDVRAPLLPGHGRTLESFAASRRSDWLNCAREELRALREKHSLISIVGLSMGGALAAILAAETPDIQALVLLAPFVDMPFNHKIAASGFWIWRGNKPRRSTNPGSIRDPRERELNVGYGAYTPRLLYELWRIGAAARRVLPAIKTPTLVMQSRTDPRITQQVTENTFASLGSKDKKLVWIEGAGHVITVDYGREQVFRQVREWIGAHATE